MPEIDAVILGSAVAGLVNVTGTIPVFFFVRKTYDDCEKDVADNCNSD